MLIMFYAPCKYPEVTHIMNQIYDMMDMGAEKQPVWVLRYLNNQKFRNLNN